ncbi:MAG TPA: DUF2948 family protein [Micropepsaceae bacterium]|nr:DUF2948 family protein [Micropepsaceae bacterium]HRK71616.1 DUF2948 family protein [Micropepsaceae bacterium]
MTASRHATSGRLRLYAQDEADLAVISATLQDAVLTIGDMAFLPRRRRFALVLNRFRWEHLADGSRRKTAERVRTGLHFDGVLKAEARHLKRNMPEAVISLLAITHEAQENGNVVLRLVLAGDGGIRLTAECIDVVMEDLSDPWPARSVPSHG